MKNTHYHVNSVSAAWAKVNEIFPTDYNKDENSSARAGYPVFRSSVEYYNYICDLGDRLEVNLENGETINIWIDATEETEAAAAEMPEKENSEEYIEILLTAKEYRLKHPQALRYLPQTVRATAWKKAKRQSLR